MQQAAIGIHQEVFKNVSIQIFTGFPLNACGNDGLPDGSNYGNRIERSTTVFVVLGQLKNPGNFFLVTRKTKESI
jgi:hypothetical protein